MSKNEKSTLKAHPPPAPQTYGEIIYIFGDDLHGIAVGASVRGRDFIANKEQAASRLNASFYLYTEMENWPTRANIQKWRGRLTQLASQLAETLGRSEQHGWVSENLHLPPGLVGELSAGLIELSAAAAVEVHDPGKREWHKWGLFHKIAPIFEECYGAKYTVTVGTKKHSASGAALRWTMALFKLAASRPEAAPAVRELASWAETSVEGLADCIKTARSELQAGKQLQVAFYSAEGLQHSEDD